MTTFTPDRQLARTSNAPYVRPRVSTHSAPRSAHAAEVDNENSRLWTSLRRALQDWTEHPEQFELGDRPAPTVICAASALARWLESQRFEAPSCAVPGGSTVIAFEWHSDDRTIVIEIDGQDGARIDQFVRGSLVATDTIDANPQPGARAIDPRTID